MKDTHKKSYTASLAGVLLPLFVNQGTSVPERFLRTQNQSSVLGAKGTFTHLCLPKDCFRHHQRNQRSVSAFRVEANLFYKVVSSQR